MKTVNSINATINLINDDENQSANSKIFMFLMMRIFFALIHWFSVHLPPNNLKFYIFCVYFTWSFDLDLEVNYSSPILLNLIFFKCTSFSNFLNNLPFPSCTFKFDKPSNFPIKSLFFLLFYSLIDLCYDCISFFNG